MDDGLSNLALPYLSDLITILLFYDSHPYCFLVYRGLIPGFIGQLKISPSEPLSFSSLSLHNFPLD